MSNNTSKILFLGVDAMDPSITKKFMAEGLMPNMQKLLERGAAQTDLEMIGGDPTVTPPMWTSLATGATPKVHGITAYGRSFDDLVSTGYNFDSNRCRAEQFWNVTAEAGKKTLVWHWPGGSWPPSSNSENLYVVDGTQPGGPNIGVAQIDKEKFVIASSKTKEVVFKQKAASDAKIPCMIDDLAVEDDDKNYDVSKIVTGARTTNVNTWDNLSQQMTLMAAPPTDVVFSPIKEAYGWTDAPKGAKEFTILHAGGLLRRPCLILQHDGVYDTVQIFKNKKSTVPIIELPNNVFVSDIIDEAYKNDEIHLANRSMRVLEIAEDGNTVRMWISAAMDIKNDDMWHPKELFNTITENVGYPQPVATVGGELSAIRDCTIASWDRARDWNADCLNYLIANEGFEVVFSHFHNVDLEGHMIVRFLKNGTEHITAETYQDLFRYVYQQTDIYIGRFLHLLDEGWTIFLISDHGQVCPEHGCVPSLLLDGAVVATHMADWGYTVLKKDETGKTVVDMSKTRATMNNTGFVWINLKGRNPEGIVEPDEQYELEEEIITHLYNLKSEKTGHRIISLALRNKDAKLIGEGGPEAGDIIYKTAEGYTLDHADSLSTTRGFFDTSVAAIFVAAGPEIKKNYLTERTVHMIDVVPTAATILGLRMPEQCEGAPVYQILE